VSPGRRHYRVSFVLLGAAVAGLTIAGAAARRKHRPEITAEPAIVAAPVVDEPAPAPSPEPALRAPQLTAPAPRPKRAVRERVKLELVDPWTGEDLTQRLAMNPTVHLEFDRADPWDPHVLYPVGPGLGEPVLETTDPWLLTSADPADSSAPTATLKKRRAPARLDRAALDTTSPWADATPAVREATAEQASQPDETTL
jgi:hypothetical protein